MEFEVFNKELLADLELLNKNESNLLKRENQSIILCRDLLLKYKEFVQKYDFQSITEEIVFFKIHKQVPLSQLVYHAEVKSFELQFPKVDKISQQKAIRKKLAKLNQFFTRNIDFVQYVDSEFSHFDKQYFTRSFLDSYYIISSQFFFQDPDFTTARDILLSKVYAYRRLLNYLEIRRKIVLEDSSTASKLNSGNLKWTASKAALTELIYALHSNNVINNGNVEIKEIATSLQDALDFDLGDFYKTYSEIKSRKISRTKFLDELSMGLIIQMEQSEI